VPRTRRRPSAVNEGGTSAFLLYGPRYSQSLERGLTILGSFTAETPVRGIADIADGLGLSRSTTHRYVSTLVELGFLEQVANRKYRLGLRVTDIGLSALNATGLREHAHSFLEELRKRLSYNVSLAVLDGPEIVYVDCVRSFRQGQLQVDLGLQAGSRLPAHCTALGKVLLAHLPESEQERLLEGMDLVERTPSTITTKRELRRELDQILEAGIALEDQENALGLVAVAAPVWDQSKQAVAAIDLSASSSSIRVEDLAEKLGSHLLSAADHISARLGYRREDGADG
jgi:IclR family transcriptional regulator, pca regulon regulatory protein